MATYLTSISETLEQAITRYGMVNDDNLTIIGGAEITIDRTPSILMGQYSVNVGKVLPVAPVVGNVNNVIGINNEEFNILGSGFLDAQGGHYSIGTTDGTPSQALTVGGIVNSYFGTQFVDVIPAIWIETGRRINYTNETGLNPEIDDWIYFDGDKEPKGRIVSVNLVSKYVVVKFLIGSILNGDGLHIRRIIDDKGEDFQIVFNATASGADLKEVGFYQSFGNAVANGINLSDSFNSELGGFVFSHIWKSNTLYLSSALGGFIPPSGCNIRVPNIHFSSCTLASYALGETGTDGTATETNRYNLATANAGNVNLKNCNLGSVYFGANGASSFNCEGVGASIDIGSVNCGTRQYFTDCVITQDIINKAISYRYSFVLIDASSGGEIINCLNIASDLSRQYVGAETSVGIVVKNCISSLAGAQAKETSNYQSYRFYRSQNILIDNCVGFNSQLAPTQKCFYFVTCNNIEIKRILVSATQTGNPSAVNSSLIEFNSLCTNIKISGIEIYKTGINTSQFIYVSDFTDFKLRCCGLIDEKLNFSSAGSYFIRFIGIGSNVEISRCWKIDGSNGVFALIPTSCKNVEILNCSGSYFAEAQASGVGSISFKGVHAGSQNFGDAFGVETDLAGTRGSHFHDIMRSDTTGMIYISFTPLTVERPNAYTILAGSPIFSVNGDMDGKAGDSIEFTMDYFALNHLSLTGLFTTSRSSGSVADGVDEWGATYLQIEFDYDIGAGFQGVYFDIRTASNLTSINTTAGIKFKVKLTWLLDRTLLNGFGIHTTTSIAQQKANFYTIDLLPDVTAKVGGIITGSRIRVYNESKGLEVANELVTGTEWSLTYTPNDEFSDGDLVSVYVTAIGKLENKSVVLASNSLGFSSLVEQVDDSIYISNAIDGSLVTEFSADFPNVEIDINDGDGATTFQRLYAWFSYIITTEQGLRDFFGGIFAEDELNYRINVSTLDLHLQNNSALPVFFFGARLYRSNNTILIKAGNAGIHIDPLKSYVARNETNILNKIILAIQQRII